MRSGAHASSASFFSVGLWDVHLRMRFRPQLPKWAWSADTFQMNGQLTYLDDGENGLHFIFQDVEAGGEFAFDLIQAVLAVVRLAGSAVHRPIRHVTADGPTPQGPNSIRLGAGILAVGIDSQQPRKQLLATGRIRPKVIRTQKMRKSISCFIHVVNMQMSIADATPIDVDARRRREGRHFKVIFPFWKRNNELGGTSIREAEGRMIQTNKQKK